MQPTSNAPGSSHGNESAPSSPKFDSPLGNTPPTPGSTSTGYSSYQTGQRSTDSDINAVLNSRQQGMAQDTKWRDAYDVADTAKDLGSKALDGVKNLSTSEIALGIGVLAAGIAFFLTKGRKHKHSKNHGSQHQDPYFGHQPHTRAGNDLSHRGQRPWGNTRYGNESYGNSYGRGRVQAGSGYNTRGGSDAYGNDSYGYNASNNRRRDQGPASGNRYDARNGGRQNPNNIDQTNSAY